MKQIDLYGKLIGHVGCVNSVEFNSTGDLLVSGSDDTHVMFWDWATKSRRLSFPSGHSDNIFQTRIMPFTDDRRIVTSSADGQVNVLSPVTVCSNHLTTIILFMIIIIIIVIVIILIIICGFGSH